MKAQEFYFKMMVGSFGFDFDSFLWLITLSSKTAIQLALRETIASILVIASVGLIVRSLIGKVEFPSFWLELCLKKNVRVDSQREPPDKNNLA